MFLSLPAEPITVDVDNLEMTPYPFKVKKIYNMNGVEAGEKYNGFMITMVVDPTDALGCETIGLQQFPFEACISSDTEVDVTAPLLEFNERGGHDEFIRRKLELKDEADSLVDSMDNARKRYERKYGTIERTNKKIYRLKFPSGTKLRSKVLECNESAAKKSGDKGLTTGGYTIFEEIEALNANNLKVLKTETDDKGTITNFVGLNIAVTPKLFWRVADMKQEEVLTGPSFVRAGKKGTDAADALFG